LVPNNRPERFHKIGPRKNETFISFKLGADNDDDPGDV
jgi:hypothetical protein